MSTATATRYTKNDDVDLYADDLGFDLSVDAYIGEGADHVRLTYTDDAEFHLMRDYITAGRVITAVSDDEGDRNPLAQWLSAKYPDTFGDVEVLIDGDMYQCIALTTRIPLPDEGLTADEIASAALPFVNTLANLTDPGTFGVPYLFDEVAAWQERATPSPAATATLTDAATYAGILLTSSGIMHADEDTAQARAAREAFVKTTATSEDHGETYRVSATMDEMRAAVEAFTF